MHEMPNGETINALINSSRYEKNGRDGANEMEPLDTYDSTIHLFRNRDA